jgi:hypothetical protein
MAGPFDAYIANSAGDRFMASGRLCKAAIPQRRKPGSGQGLKMLHFANAAEIG